MPTASSGPTMMADFRRQAERFGAEFVTDDVTRVDFSERPFRVYVGGDEHRADSVIVATGASARQLGLPSEQTLQGRGVSYCATCDGAFFRDKVVVVVGGGDSAMEEATFLTRFASKVVIVHRRDEFRASPIMVDRARENEKVEFVLNAVVDEVLGEGNGHVTGLRLRDTVDGRTDARSRPTGCSSPSGTTRRPRSSSTGSTTTSRGTSSRSRARRGRTSRASSPQATSRTTRIARRSRPPARARWPHSTRSAGSRSSATSPRSRPPRPEPGSDRSARYPRALWPRAGSTSSIRPAKRCWRRSPARRPRGLEALLAPSAAAMPRPLLEGHGAYVFGVLVRCCRSRRTSDARGGRHRRDAERLVTVRKTPTRAPTTRAVPRRPSRRVRRRPDLSARRRRRGHLPRPLDAIYAEIDALEDQIDELHRAVRRRLAELRHELLHRRGRCRRHAAVRRVSTDASTSATRALPAGGRALFGDTYDTLVRAPKSSMSPATCSRAPVTTSVEDRREPERGREEADGHRVARARAVAHRRLLRPELRGRVRRGFWTIGVSTGSSSVSTLMQLALFRWRRWI